MAIMAAIKFKSPQCHIIHAVFTIPHDHALSLAPERQSYNSIFHLIEKTISLTWPDSAAILNLHNWSSSNPEDKHLHIHCLIVCMHSDATIFHGFTDTYKIRRTFQTLLDYPTLPVVHLSYHSISADKEIYHLCRYLVRSPILDYCRDMLEPLTLKYISRVSLLERVHRLRYIGWLGNRIRHNISCPICLIELPDDDDERWETIGTVTVTYDSATNSYITDYGTRIYPEEITSFDDSTKIPRYILASSGPP